MHDLAPKVGRPCVVILGGGFAGLLCAKGLARAPVDVTLIDRRNHHLFQPLLYQVAMAALSPSQIAHPIRAVVERQRNTRVLLAEATGIDAARRVVSLSGEGAPAEIAYDYLVVGVGVTHSYFGHDDWAPYAPGLKTLEDALEIRRRFLLAFERAEGLSDEAARRENLTFVVIGGGPTGVELAGAMVEIATRTMPKEFRNVDTRTARVVLVEAMDRLLPGGFPQGLSARALKDLRELGVDVRLSTRVTRVDGEGVVLESAKGVETLRARNVFWAAGVRANPLAASLGVPLEKNGRVVVGGDLTIPGRPEVFVAGDLAHVIDAKTDQPVPGMAPGAMQMGRFVGRVIASETKARASGRAVPAREKFVYKDKGLLATIGRARAVAHLKGIDFSGFFAWALWALVHVFYLISFRSKIMVMFDWAWSYLFFERGSRLITGREPSAKGVSRPT